jgi:hypothetical protein
MHASLALITSTLLLGNLGNWFNNTFNHSAWVKQTCIKWQLRSISRDEAAKRLGMTSINEAYLYCQANGIIIGIGRD